ncbi:insulinase family protein, partial [bacterium]|nr:insulinase family protein [bacterium]
KREWKKMAKDGVSIEELKQAKSSLISSFNLRFASVNSISDMLVSMQKFNLGQDFLNRRNDYIADVTLKEVNAAAKKYFNTIPTFVSIGNHKSEVK